MGREACHSRVSETLFYGGVVSQADWSGAPPGATIVLCVTVRAGGLHHHRQTRALARGPGLAFPSVCSSWLCALFCLLQDLRLPGIRCSTRRCFSAGSKPASSPQLSGGACHLAGVAQEAPRWRIPTCKRPQPCVVTWPMASC